MFDILNLKSVRKKNGFTIVELILVVSVLGILSTIAINNFNRQLQSARLKQATQAFTNFAKVSKSISLSSASPCVLMVSHEEAQITISNPNECTKRDTLNLIDDSNNLQNLAICGTNDTSNINMLCDEENDGSDIDMNGNPESSTSIEFTPKGTVSKGGLVKLYSPDIKQGYCVIVTSPVGLIRKTPMHENTCNFSD
jgi:prepilin-type N-terminal cleavage/methylation domain-containing protein|tara:strand:- start:463 stop:1053 length:591 start_codon:yes stop_codon:yes gene_type:complete